MTDLIATTLQQQQPPSAKRFCRSRGGRWWNPSIGGCCHAQVSQQPNEATHYPTYLEECLDIAPNNTSRDTFVAAGGIEVCDVAGPASSSTIYSIVALAYQIFPIPTMSRSSSVRFSIMLSSWWVTFWPVSAPRTAHLKLWRDF